MEFKHIYSFDNYIEANIILGRLQNEHINCWLKDEHTATLSPWGVASGIRLMVAESQAERAMDLLRQFQSESPQSNQ